MVQWDHELSSSLCVHILICAVASGGAVGPGAERGHVRDPGRHHGSPGGAHHGTQKNEQDRLVRRVVTAS